MHYHIRAFVGGTILPLLLLGCSHQETPNSGPGEPVVRVATPVLAKVTDYEYFTGRTDAKEYVEIRAQVTGYLTKVDFVPGKEVKKDQPLFLVDPAPYKAAYDLAKAQVTQNEAKLELAVANLKRGKDISKTPGAISQAELDQMSAEEKAADAAVKSAKANVEAAKINLDFTDLKSPIDGVVSRDLITVGNLVTPGTLLTTVASMNPMYGYFNVNEPAVLRVQKLIRDGKIQSVRDGGKMTVDFALANDGQTYPHSGEIDFVNNELDPSTGTLQVRGLLNNPQLNNGKGGYLLTPGLYIRVRVPIGQPHEALVVPQAALGTDLGKKFVYVVNDKNIVENREVTAGPQQPDGTQVVVPIKMKVDGSSQEIDSLTPKDRIIVGGLQRVRAGVKVKIKEAK